MTPSSNGGGGHSAASLDTLTTDTALTAEVADHLERQAGAAIENVETPDQAEQLLARVRVAADALRIARLGDQRARRWGIVVLKAQRRYGELLGQAKRGGVGENQYTKKSYVTSSDAAEKTGAERNEAYRARQVATVPEAAFVAYVESAEKPSYSGLVREARGIGAVPPPRKRKPPSEANRRIRELRETQRTGELMELQRSIAKMVGRLEDFRLPGLPWTEFDEMVVAELFDDLTNRLAKWTDAAIDTTAAHLSQGAKQRKIDALRQRAADPSSTQAERMTASRLVARLTRKQRLVKA